MVEGVGGRVVSRVAGVDITVLTHKIRSILLNL